MFTEPRALVFLPKLARLVPDEGRRKALLRAPKMASVLKHNESLASKGDAPPAAPQRSTAAAAAAAAAVAVAAEDFDAPPPTAGAMAGATGGPRGGGGGPPAAPFDPASLSPDAKQVGRAGERKRRRFVRGARVCVGLRGRCQRAQCECDRHAECECDRRAECECDWRECDRGLALQVHEMFPSLPVPAVLAALQDAPVAAVIERALAGRVDPNAVPRPADPAKLQVIR